MGALVDDHYNAEVENGGVGLGDCISLGVEDEPETLVIEEFVRILLQGLGEDINREGLRKTPFRVAKALWEGTKGVAIGPVERTLKSHGLVSDANKQDGKSPHEVIHWHNRGVAARALHLSRGVENQSGRVTSIVVLEGLYKFSVQELSTRGASFSSS